MLNLNDMTEKTVGVGRRTVSGGGNGHTDVSQFLGEKLIFMPF